MAAADANGDVSNTCSHAYDGKVVVEGIEKEAYGSAPSSIDITTEDKHLSASMYML